MGQSCDVVMNTIVMCLMCDKLILNELCGPYLVDTGLCLVDTEL